MGKSEPTLAELEARAKRRGDKPALNLIKEIRKRDKLHMNKMHEGRNPPKVGDDIYVPTRMYIDHGEDDVDGGLAEVIKVELSMSAGDPKCPFVTVKEHPNSSYNWKCLMEEQDDLKKEFKKRRAKVNPDYG